MSASLEQVLADWRERASMARRARAEGRMTQFRVRPFANGSEYDSWLAGNCDRCQAQLSCPLRSALHWAYWTDGLIERRLLAEYGLVGSRGPLPLWMRPCTRRVPGEEP